jgi:hypothetical protein
VWYNGAPVLPFLNLSVAVTKRKSPCTIVETCRPIYHARLATPGITLHRECRVVDAVGVFVQKDKEVGRPRVGHIALLHIIEVAAIGQPLASSTALGRISTERLAHGDATDSRQRFPSKSYRALVSRAFKYFGILKVLAE